MNRTKLPRKLWYVDVRDRVCVGEDFLRTDPRPLVVLGEAGMGKSTLLEQLSGVDGYACCTARKLINSPNPTALLGDASTLVVDALDEVSAHRDGDAVDLVLRKLGALGSPRFIVSCRVADWRSATALQGISDLYDASPLELHLEPLGRDDAVAFVAALLGMPRAQEIVAHLEDRGLTGLWGNPQTLELVARVAGAGNLPESKGELFSEATSLLRAEHREEKADTALASMPEADLLDAAGAAFASLILTGRDALSRKATVDIEDLRVAEVTSLPGVSQIGVALSSRLFEARGPERFTYTHRAIGEFLGARWLARNADTPRKRRRLLELFGGQALVPASLRGIYAWLAWHSPELASAVIAADPMGVIEYGDADRLNVEQGRQLLTALESHSRENPRFLDWGEYRVRGIAHKALLPTIKEILTGQDVEFRLRLLVLQALNRSSLAADLSETLLDLLLAPNDAFANRSEAGGRLTELNLPIDWANIISRLSLQDNDDGVRLALNLMHEIGYARFDDALLLDVVLAQLRRSEHTVGVFLSIERNIPRERLDALLDGLAVAAGEMSSRQERVTNDEFTDLVYGLLARRLEWDGINAARLWTWMRPFDSQVGYRRETREVVARQLRANDELRRAVQRHVLLDPTGDKTVWQRSWRLNERSTGFATTEEDVVLLLGHLDSDDKRWRDLVQLVRHSATDGAAVRAGAQRFVANAEDEDWLAKLPEPRMSEWQIEQEARRRKQQVEREVVRARHRAEFEKRIDAIRAGEYGAVVNPAKAYLKLFHDIGEEVTDGPARLEEWLGPKLRDSCLEGFEVFLTADPPRPTATDIAQGYAESRQWDAAKIIVAALAERVRTGRLFDDLPDERLLAGLFEVRHTRIDDHAGIPELDGILAEEVRGRGAWEVAQRLYIEPQFEQRRENVDGLYALMRDERDAPLAAALAREWLTRYPDMPALPEIELVDRLILSDENDTFLSDIARVRSKIEGLSNERRRNWEAIGLIVDFDHTYYNLDADAPIERDLLWSIRARQSGHYYNRPNRRLDAQQLAWAIGTFRPLFPSFQRPLSVTTGDTNPWDASDYIFGLISQLGEETSDDAVSALTALRDAPTDGYTEHLRIVAAEQRRKRVEIDWVAPELATISATVADLAPTTPAQLQAVVLEELQIVQRKVRGSDVDWYKDFFAPTGAPRVEDDCRDTILKMVRPLPFGIEALPEGHLADEKRSDIICLIGNLMMPIEVKGQWHPKLWTAADRQLDRLYINDYRAERGIYLVLWFGTDSRKPVTNPPDGASPPKTADELREALKAGSATTRKGRTEVVVLDLTRPA